MPNSRQHDYLELARSFGVTLSQTQLAPPTSQTWNLLVYASKGVLTVRTETGTWVVPPHRAVWVPASVACKLDVVGQTALRMVYLRKTPKDRSGPSFDPAACAVINVTPLLRELILRVVRIGALMKNVPNHQRITGLIHDELRAMGTAPLQLPYPHSELATRFVVALESEGDDSVDVEQALRECGSSKRTMERLFHLETGMSLGRWNRRRKLLAGLRLLISGETTTSVAFSLGYSNPSSFIAMFRRELGTTPGSYLQVEPRSDGLASRSI